jgi:hypothetical protein
MFHSIHVFTHVRVHTHATTHTYKDIHIYVYYTCVCVRVLKRRPIKDANAWKEAEEPVVFRFLPWPISGVCVIPRLLSLPHCVFWKGSAPQ